MSGKLVLRVASKAGRQRVETSDNATWGEFQKLVAQRCGVEAGKQKFQKDSASGGVCSFDPNTILKNCNIKNGDQLFLSAVEGEIKVGQDAVMQPMHRLNEIEGKGGEEGKEGEDTKNGDKDKSGWINNL